MKTNTVEIPPKMLKWARERGNFSVDMLKSSFPHFEKWESGEKLPTFKQLEAFAKKVHIPIGYLFLPEPIEEKLPITDFRTINTANVRFSVDLLDTIYLCQQRQEWYHNYAISQSLPLCNFVGSKNISDTPIEVAKYLRELLSFSLSEQKKASNYEELLRALRTKVEDIGILLMISGKVGSNTHRLLSLDEFRGFALSDSHAPLIFINAVDSEAGRIFTLAHELAHILLGESGVSDVLAGHVPNKNIELWCNKVAAEFLVPMQEMISLIEPMQNHYTNDELADKISKYFKVSSFVAVRRLFDADIISESELGQMYSMMYARIKNNKQKASSGGDYYLSFPVATSKRFAQAVIASTLEGHTLFKESLNLLSVKKMETFYQAAKQLGVQYE